MIRVLRAELVRTRGSAALVLTLVGLVFAVLSSRFAAAAGAGGTIRELMNWQSLYATGLAAPIMTLLAGAVSDRESAAREGGTRWRSTARSQILIARVLVLGGLSGIFHLLSYGGTAVVAYLHHLEGAGSIVAVAGLIGWVSSWALCIPGLVLAELIGTVPAVLAAIGLQIAGTMFAEESWWWAVPPTWSVRPSLWALRVHQNAVPLGTGEAPIITEPWSALILCALTAVVAAAVLIALEERARWMRWGSRGGRTVAAPRRTMRGGALGAAHLGLHSSAAIWLSLGAVLLMAVVAVVQRPGAVGVVFSYGVLPIGSIVLPVIAWSAVRDAWRITALRGPRVRLALVARIVLHIIAMVIVAVFAVLVEGSPENLPRKVLLWVLTASVVALASLAMTIRFGSGAAVAGGLLWWIFSVTFAGDVLAATPLWAVSLPLWAECADTPARVAIAIPSCIGLLAALLIAIRHVERRRLRTA